LARLYVAQGHAAGGRPIEAHELFKSLEESPTVTASTRLEALYRWMNFEAHVENWKESQRIAQEIIKSYGNSAEAFEARFRVGESQVQRGEFENASQTLAALRSDPALPMAEWKPQLELLWAESQLGLKENDYAPLRTALEAFLATNPAPGLADQAHEILGRTDYQEGKFEEARKHLLLVVNSEASAKTELAAKAQLMIGDCFLSEKDYENATSSYQRVYSTYALPDWQAPALLQIAACDMTTKDWGQAKSTLELLIKEFPAFAQAKEVGKLLETVQKNLPASDAP